MENWYTCNIKVLAIQLARHFTVLDWDHLDAESLLRVDDEECRFSLDPKFALHLRDLNNFVPTPEFYTQFPDIERYVTVDQECKLSQSAYATKPTQSQTSIENLEQSADLVEPTSTRTWVTSTLEGGKATSSPRPCSSRQEGFGGGKGLGASSSALEHRDVDNIDIGNPNPELNFFDLGVDDLTPGFPAMFS